MRSFVFALLLVPATICSAEMYGAEYARCNQNTTVAIVECVDTAVRRWDKRLNRSYKDLMKRLEPDQQAALKSAQRLWIKYRDANCAFYGAGSGTISRIEAVECMRSMTQERTCELQAAQQGERVESEECRAIP